MPTCPNCGEIVMNGDPYCPHCGTTFRWFRDEEEDEKSNPSNFRQYLETAKRIHDEGEYSRSFTFLLAALSEYGVLSNYEKMQLGENPIKQDWIIDTLCNTYNTHDINNMKSVNRLIKKHNFIFNLCEDCALIYPTDSIYCKKCGKLLEKPYMHRNPDRVREEIDSILKGKFVNEYHRFLLKSKALELIESNDSNLEEIRDGFGGGLTFVFKKEHEFFHTIYECWFDPDNTRLDRVFYDCMCYSNHDRLLQNSSFKNAVRKIEKETGYAFLNCGGGYEDVDIDIVTEDMMFTDKFRVFVRFKIDEKRIAVYDIDLDRMELNNERIYFD